MAAARVAVVTSAAGIAYDVDLPPLVEALRAAGLAAEAVAWDAAGVEWSGFDLALIRSTWGYTTRLDEFLAWADKAGRATRLWNPPAVVRWNSDKRYLPELAARGVAVVPTRVVDPGDHCEEDGFDLPTGVVVKPAVSAGARDTARYEPGRHADAVRHARMLLGQGRSAMVQPYLPLVAEGERALVFLPTGGRLTFSHAIRKQPVLTEPNVIDNFRDAHPGVAPYEPTGAEIRTALDALAAVPAPDALLFARVDLALDDSRTPVVMELELIEPNLFLQSDPRALERFVAAVAAVAGATEA